MSLNPTSSERPADTLQQVLGSGRLPALDALRAIAVALVVLAHIGVPGMSGALGVMIFFVLSGFLITHLLLREASHTGRFSLGAFYLRRTLRVAPAFIVYWLFVMVLARVVDYEFPPGQPLASLLYVNNYYQAINGDASTPLSHTWSLAIEEQFYLLWPLLLLFFVTRRKSPALLVSLVICAVWIWRAWLKGFAGAGDWAQFAFDARADHLLDGCLLAVLLHAGSLRGLSNIACSKPYLPWLTITALALVTYWSRSPASGGDPYAIGYVVQPLLVALLILQLLALAGTTMWSWLAARPIVFVGTISYSIYLYQQIVAQRAMRILDDAPAGLAYAGAIAATLVAASCSYYLVEKPFLRLKSRFSKE